MVKKTKGGIILTDKNMEEQQYLNSKGRVIAMGRECYNNRSTNWCTSGDTIVYSRYAGSRIDVQGVKMLLLNDDEVLAVLPNPDAVTQQF
jgi:chaperonin GroES